MFPHLLSHVLTKMNAHLDQIIAIEPMAIALTILDLTDACLTQAADFYSNSKKTEIEMPTQMNTMLKLMILLRSPTIAMLQCQMHLHCLIISLSL